MPNPTCGSRTTEHWRNIGSRPSPSWYLDRLVAEQKRRIHQDLIRHWAGPCAAACVLKTDSFEEAFGDDQILFDLFPDARLVIGMDVAWETVQRAHARCGDPAICFVTGDVRKLCIGPKSVDLVVSTSTLDHFDSREQLSVALAELGRAVRPGGLAIVTLDNPENPLYRVLRWASRRGMAPFALGCTASLSTLVQLLEQQGFEVVDTAILIHNPRLISTLLFLALRRLLGHYADAPIRWALACFALLGRLPTARYTACFVAACARKRC